MANVYAVKSGNWSDATLWNTGSLPDVIDDVYASGFTVYVDTNIQVLSINTIGATGIGGGGTFRPNNGVVMTTNVVAGSTTCVTFGSASPNAFTLIGSITGGNASTNAPGIDNVTTGTITVFGNVFGGLGTTANAGHRGIFNRAAGTVNIIGDVIGGQQGHPGVLNNSSTGVVNVTGICYGGYIAIAGAVPGASNGFENTGILNVVGGAIGGAGSSSAGINHTSSTSVTLYGNVSGFGSNSSGVRNNSTGTINIIGNTYGGQGTSTPGTWNISTGTINLTGNCYGYGFIPIDLRYLVNGTGGFGIYNAGNGTVNVRGDVFSSNIRGDAWGIDNQNAGIVTVIGNVYGGTVGNAYGVRNNNTTSITIISGSAIGGIGSAAYGAFNSSTGILRVKRAVGNDWGLGYTTALAGTPGVFSNVQGSQTFVEELQCGPRGQWPTGGVIFFTPNSKATSMFETDTFQNYSLVQSNSADSLVPAVSSVRQGTVYNLGSNTGTCIIPPVSSVAVNTLVDNLTGTAVLTPQTTWSYPTTASDVNSMGGRLRNALNTNSANSLINSFNP